MHDSEEAILAGDLSRVRQLVRDGAAVNRDARQAMSPLHLALRQFDTFGASPDLVVLLIEAGADAQELDVGGCPILSWAVRSRVPAQVVRMLLDRGAPVNQLNLEQRRTPLHYAALEGGDPEVAGLLIGAGADVDALDQGGAAPLLMAQQAGHDEVAALLEARGALGHAGDVIEQFWQDEPVGPLLIDERFSRSRLAASPTPDQDREELGRLLAARMGEGPDRLRQEWRLVRDLRRLGHPLELVEYLHSDQGLRMNDYGHPLLDDGPFALSLSFHYSPAGSSPETLYSSPSIRVGCEALELDEGDGAEEVGFDLPC